MIFHLSSCGLAGVDGMLDGLDLVGATVNLYLDVLTHVVLSRGDQGIAAPPRAGRECKLTVMALPRAYRSARSRRLVL